MSQTPATMPTGGKTKSEYGRRLMQEPETWLDAATTYLADRCSPILVKETRQALKSRQFQWTFLLLLAAVVVWSFMGISFSMRNGYEESGATMLIGYLIILGFPLCVVIPMAAFRSLAREYEDETIQLVSITTMSARRIVLGKLGSAILQIILYMAAVTPCIVFSYVLRGLSFSMIWVGCLLAFTGSAGLTTIALAMAGACRNVILRVAANLVLLVALLGTYFLWCAFVGEMPNISREEEIFNAMSNFVAILFATAAYVFVEATASLISFAAENRSTRVRISILILAAVILAGSLGVGLQISEAALPIQEFVFVASIVGTHFLVITGLMTSSERSGLSNRVRRELPKTLLGRFARGLFLPGPGRGFLFALFGVLSYNGVLAIVGGLSEELGTFAYLAPSTTAMTVQWWEVMIVNCVFGCGYLSFVYLLMLMLEKPSGALKVLVGLMLGIIVYVLMAIASFTAHEFVFSTMTGDDFSQAYYLNWPAMIGQATSYQRSLGYHLYAFLLMVGLPVGLLTLVAYFVAIKELVIAAAAMPARVVEEMKRPAATPRGETFEEIFQQRQADTAMEGGES